MAKQKSIIILFLLILLIGAGIFLWSKYLPKENQEAGLIKPEKPKITVFYSPTCSCCKEYIAYLKKQDFQVDAKAVRDMLSIKEKYQIPSEIEACHTSVIDGYFVEGHAPKEAIKKLLTEKPAIKGIALPRMPAGAPGMGGFKQGSLEIYSLLSNDQIVEFSSW